MTMDERDEWPPRAVGQCFKVLTFPGKPKVLARDYQPSGRFPVVDQGQGRIAGWTNDEGAVVESPLPVIVFGDHTRELKFIDFPFARGADGTQILKSSEDIDTLFLYYACRSLSLPSRGYNRHLALLREQQIAVPPSKDEQRAVGRVLRAADAAREHQDLLVDSSERLKRSTMRALFTKGLRGEPLKETEIGAVPVSWDIVPLIKVCGMSSGGTPPKADPKCWIGDVPWVSGKDLKANRLQDVRDHISREAAAAHSKIAPKGSVLVLMRGMGLANGFALSLIERPMAFNQDLKALIPDTTKVSGDFLMHTLTFAGQRMLRNVATAAHGTMRLTTDDLEGFVLALPAADEQDEIVAILDTIDRKIDLHRRKRALLNELFKSLLHKLMTGEIRVADLDLSALPERPDFAPALDMRPGGTYE